MAATVRPDDHHVLMRRIGYSVALEPVPSRVPELIAAYASTNIFDRAAWYGLARGWEMPSGVHEQRKKRAEHFLDVVSALGFTIQSDQILSAAPPLEAGATAVKCEAELAATASALLLLQIVEKDGDNFLNVLQAAGDRAMFGELLNDVIERRREILLPLFLSSTLRDKLDRILDVARENPPRRKREPRSEISRDLIDKVVETRWRWAEKLGVVQNGRVTPLGERLVSNVRGIAETTEHGALLLWPYDYELAALRIQPERLSSRVRIPRVWDAATSVVRAVADLAPGCAPIPLDQVLADVQAVHEIYNQLNPGKSALAAQMPLTVINLAYALIAGLRDRLIGDWPATLADQRGTKESSIVYMRRAGSEGTILFR